MTPPEHIFRAYDIRGIAGSELSETFARQLGRAISAEYPEAREIAIGRDGRHSSDALALALIEGLSDAGVTVHDVGQVPTPVLYFATHEFGHGSGVMVTGSHNPPEYNGFKLVMQDHTLAGDDIQALRARMLQDLPCPGGGDRIEKDVSDAYVKRIAGDIQLTRPMRVALDAGNGAAGPIAVRVLRACGAEVTELYCDIDGDFPNHHPNPSDAKNLQDLKASVLQDGLEVGIALDGDGDRCGVIDDAGEILWADRQLMVHATDVLEREPGATVVFDVKCSSLLPRVIEESGGAPVMARTGHSFIKAKMRETRAALAGEMSGHLFFQERWYGFDDGIYAAARLLQILAKKEEPASAVFGALPQACVTPEINIPFEVDGDQHRFIEKFSACAEFPGARLTRIDGVRADFDDGFGLARASNTTPYVVTRFEGTTSDVIKRIQAEFRSQMLAVDSGLELPF